MVRLVTIDNYARPLEKVGGRQHFHWKLFIDEPDSILSKIDSVSYTLPGQGHAEPGDLHGPWHPTFPKGSLVQNNPKEGFALEMAGWDEVTIILDIRFKDGQVQERPQWLDLGKGWPDETIDQRPQTAAVDTRFYWMTVGTAQHKYDVMPNWANLAPGVSFGPVSSVAVDSYDRVYVLHRKDPNQPILVFDADGNYLSSWGGGAINLAHGMYIGTDDTVCLTDRGEHVAMKYTLDGKPLIVLGNRGQPSDTGCKLIGRDVIRAGGPFNMPTHMVTAPSGDMYVSDGDRNCRIHQFSPEGKLVRSWGTPGSGPGQIRWPHGLWVDQEGLVYVCDKGNSRIQVFSSTGEYTTQWTDLDHPVAMYMDATGTSYISEEGIGRISVVDKHGKVLTRWSSPKAHGICGDSQGNLYLACHGRSVIKYVKKA